METGISNDEKAKIRQDYAEGKIDRAALLKGESDSYHSPGTCTFYGTANSNQMLMEIMGNKTATELDLSKTDKEEKAEPTVEVTSETKDIVGYKCTKTIVRDADGNEAIMWIASDLKASLKGQQQFGNSKVNGVPLEFSTVNNGMTIHFIATKFTKKVDKKAFSLKIPEGYTTVSEDDLKNMGGGM